ncbi:MAG: hypothetical protein ABH813_00400 [Patescibacteria group bacterium]
MTKKNITIEDLARMVAKGFAETAKKKEADLRFNKVDKRFDKIDERLENIEKLLIVQHQRRIEKLESDVKELRELLAVK